MKFPGHCCFYVMNAVEMFLKEISLRKLSSVKLSSLKLYTKTETEAEKEFQFYRG